MNDIKPSTSGGVTEWISEWEFVWITFNNYNYSDNLNTSSETLKAP